MFGTEVVPNSTYEVQRVDVSCASLGDESCYSEPLVVETAKWGDVAAPFSRGASQPDFFDISQLVDKFQRNPGTPSKPRSQLAGDSVTPDGLVDFNDISATVDGFQQFSFAFSGPGTCP